MSADFVYGQQMGGTCPDPFTCPPFIDVSSCIELGNNLPFQNGDGPLRNAVPRKMEAYYGVATGAINIGDFYFEVNGVRKNTYTEVLLSDLEEENANICFRFGINGGGYNCYNAFCCVPLAIPATATYCKCSGVINVEATEGYDEYYIKVSTGGTEYPKINAGNSPKFAIVNPAFPSVPTEVLVYGVKGGHETRMNTTYKVYEVTADFTTTQKGFGSVLLTDASTLSVADDEIKSREWRVFPANYTQNERPDLSGYTTVAGTGETLTETLNEAGQWVALIVENSICCRDTALKFVVPDTCIGYSVDIATSVGDVNCGKTVELDVPSVRTGYGNMQYAYKSVDAADYTLVPGANLSLDLSVGTYSYLWKATDDRGNILYCTTKVVLTDGVPPVCGNPVIELPSGDDCKVSGSEILTQLKGVDYGTDDCVLHSEDPLEPNSSDLAKDYAYTAAGEYFRYTLKDAAGNTSACSSSVKVIVPEPVCEGGIQTIASEAGPTVSGAGVALPNVSSCLSTVLKWSAVENGTARPVSDLASSQFTSGDIVYWTVEDASGQQGHCQSYIMAGKADATYCPTSGVVNVSAPAGFDSYAFQEGAGGTEGLETYAGTSPVFAFMSSIYPSKLTQLKVFGVKGGLKAELSVSLSNYQINGAFSVTQKAENLALLTDISTFSVAGDGATAREWRVYPPKFGENNRPDVSASKVVAGTENTLTQTIDPSGQWVALILENMGCCRDTVMQFVKPDTCVGYTLDVVTTASDLNCRKMVELPLPSVPSGYINPQYAYKIADNNDYVQVLSEPVAVELLVGEDGILWNVVDENGNFLSCKSHVRVTDGVPPVCDKTDVILESGDDCLVTGKEVFDKLLEGTYGSDNCMLHYEEPVSVAASELEKQFSIAENGALFHYTLKDISGNTAACSSKVILTAPDPLCENANLAFVKPVGTLVSGSEITLPDVTSCVSTSLTWSTESNAATKPVTELASAQFDSGDVIYWTVSDETGKQGYCQSRIKVLAPVATYCPTSGIVDVTVTEGFSSYACEINGEKISSGISNVFAFKNPNYPAAVGAMTVFVKDGDLEWQSSVEVTTYSITPDFSQTDGSGSRVTLTDASTFSVTGDQATSWEWRVFPSSYTQENEPDLESYTVVAGTAKTLEQTIDPCGQWVALIVENAGCCKDTVLRFVVPAPECESGAPVYEVTKILPSSSESNCGATGLPTPEFAACSVSWTVGERSGTGSVSNVYFEDGDVISWTLTNGTGSGAKTATCPTTISVTDQTKPNCPGSPVSVGSLATTNDVCSYSQQDVADLFNAKDLSALGSDNCALDKAEIDWTKTGVTSFVPKSDGTAEIYTFYYKLTDKAGLQNDGYCQATVVVTDNTEPVCPASQETILIETGENCYATGAEVKAEFDKAEHIKGSHPCGKELTYEYVNVVDNAPFFPYDTPFDLVVYRLKAANNNIAQCTIKVQVRDTRTLKCTSPAVQTLNAVTNCMASLSDIELSSSNYDVECPTTNKFPESKRYSSVSYEYKLHSSSSYTPVASADALRALNLGIGEYDVRTTFSRAGSTGYVASQAVCEQRINIIDATAPKCNAVTPEVVSLTDACSARFSNLLKVSDNCALDRVLWQVEGATTIPSGSHALAGETSATIGDLNNVDFKPGVTTINWTVYDKSGLSSTCSSVVSITDKRPIECSSVATPLDIPVSDYSDCNVVNLLSNAAYIPAAARYSVECPNDDTPVVTRYQVQPAGRSAVVYSNANELNSYSFGIGTYYLHTSFKAANGKTAICEQTLNFIDTHAPKLVGVWPSDISGQNSCKSSADISGLLSDNEVKSLYADCSKIKVTHTDVSTGDDCAWTVTRNYIIEDAAKNSTSKSMSVSGGDKVIPVISTTAESGNKGCNPTIVAPVFTGTDNCEGDISAKIAVTTTGVQGTGCEKTQSWTANYTDGCNNKADEVVVTYTWTEDKIKPVITTELSNADKGCNWDKSDAPKVSDFTLTESCDNTAKITLTAGTEEINGCKHSQTWTATCTDACGNVAEPVAITYTWTVDTEKPVISTTAESGNEGCNPTIVAPVFTGTDNCEGDISSKITVT
ncbi:MAG: hypothetical protein IKP81_13450, partial [Paludibacteraceae bacterium]|nr:hypothetical protein [Paludibacteraceae bacterium]